MKKIYLQITPFFPTAKSFRGPYIYDQVKAIGRNSDFEVVVIKTVSPYTKNYEKSYMYGGIRVHSFQVYDLPSSVFPGLFHSLNVVRLERFIRNELEIPFSDIAVIHSHVAYPAGALAADLGRRHGIKNVVQHHGLDVMQLTNGRLLRGPLQKANERFIRRRFLKTVNTTDLNIGVSRKVIDEIMKTDGVRNQKSYVLYNGVDREKFYRLDASKEKERFEIGCIGNFWPIKGQITLLKALNKVVKAEKTGNIHVTFVGSGPELSRCLTFVKEHQLEEYVTFRPEIDHSRLNDFYNSLDLFVLPSYYEALGCVYTEALQVGVPVIAVEGQGIEELIREKDRPLMLIGKDDVDKLSELILKWKNLPPHQRRADYDLSIDRFITDFLKREILQ
ncbi:glycosyltransferase [Hydrogenimonas sp. SS33]|uniref:glycosyltransferase n=1 Tax=Hydrogenimonas leucolamina TaxID=2954236 RepID=UPI00336BD60E